MDINTLNRADAWFEALNMSTRVHFIKSALTESDSELAKSILERDEHIMQLDDDGRTLHDQYLTQTDNEQYIAELAESNRLIREAVKRCQAELDEFTAK